MKENSRWDNDGVSQTFTPTRIIYNTMGGNYRLGEQLEMKTRRYDSSEGEQQTATMMESRRRLLPLVLFTTRWGEIIGWNFMRLSYLNKNKITGRLKVTIIKHNNRLPYSN